MIFGLLVGPTSTISNIDTDGVTRLRTFHSFEATRLDATLGVIWDRLLLFGDIHGRNANSFESCKLRVIRSLYRRAVDDSHAAVFLHLFGWLNRRGFEVCAVRLKQFLGLQRLKLGHKRVVQA